MATDGTNISSKRTVSASRQSLHRRQQSETEHGMQSTAPVTDEIRTVATSSAPENCNKVCHQWLTYPCR